jgi:transcriptional regulator with XRE-family HTH domain
MAAVARVKAAMEAQSISMEALAERANLSYGTIWRVLHGNDFRISTLEALATALKIPIRDIFKAA